jgi:hypothetical protein
MADINIKAGITVDTGNANAGLKEVQGQLEKTGKAVQSIDTDTAGATGSFSKLKSGLTDMSPALGGVESGIGKVSSAFKVLLANPVVLILSAIVAVLYTMYEAFKNSFEGGQKLEQVFAGIKAVGQSLIDSLDKIGSAIVKVFSFDFSGARKEMQSVVDSANNAYSSMSKLTQQAQQLHKEQLANDLDQAERAKKLAILREQATDESVPLAKRKAALLELKKDAEQNSKDDIDLAKRTTENRIAQLTLQKDGAKKNQDEINKLKIEQINVETDNANELRRIGKQLTAADKAEKSEQDAAAKEQLAKQKELLKQREEIEKAHQDRLKKIQEDGEKAIQQAINETKKANRENELKANEIEYKQRMQLAENAGLSTFKIIEAYQFKRSEINDKYNKEEADAAGKAEKEATDLRIEQQTKFLAAHGSALEKQIEDEKAATEVKKQLAEIEYQTKVASLNAIGTATEVLGDIVGKQTAVGKGLGIATALINTYTGVTEALKQKSTLPSPFDVIAKVANVAAVLATGMKAVKAITSVQVPGFGGGGGSAASLSVAAPVLPQQTSTQLNASSIQAVGNAAQGGVVRAYMLDADAANAADRAARLNRAARLG